jgi:lysylphosphatidylglycerol synthetase-like protein (DUF2156 family)
MTTAPIPSATPATPPPVAPTPAAPVGWVIAGMILFWPTGIPALLSSHRAAHALGAHDLVTAERETTNARRWGIISVIVGAAVIVLSLLSSILWAFLAVLALHDVNGGDWDGPRWSDERSFDGPARPGLPDAPDSDR